MKILTISNMYPSVNYPHYGIFVKKFDEQLQTLGYNVQTINMTKSNNYCKKIVKYIFFYTRIILNVVFKKYDKIYLHYPSICGIPFIFLIKLKKNINLIVNFHGNDLVFENNGSRDEKLFKITKNIIDFSEKIIVPSEYFKQIAINKFPEKNIIVYPSAGVDLNEFFPIEKKIACNKLDLDKEVTYIGFVSRIEHKKGWDIFIKAAKKLVIDNNKEYKFIIIGQGKEYSEMISLIKKYEIEKYFLLKNYLNHSEMNLYINSFDMFIFPTMRKGESLGLVGIEAMATGAIVISSDKYGPTSYINDKKNGYLFEMGNEQKLAEKILEIENKNSSELSKLKVAAIETANEYSIENIKIKIPDIMN